MKVVIRNAVIANNQLIDETPRDILIEDGIIKKIEQNLDFKDIEIIDASGYIVMPGLIDMCCHICDPGFERKEDINTASMSASRGGFTSITCEPDTKPAIDNKTVIEYIISRSKIEACVNIYPYGSMTKDCEGCAISEIGEMRFAGASAISDGGCSINNSNLLKNIFTYSKIFDIPIITHCEDADLVADGVMNEGIMSTTLGLKGRPREAEDIIVARDIILAENIGCKLHMSSISTKGAVQLIREAKERGVNITAQTSPHYFILTEEAISEYNTFAKVKPPLRTQEDVECIISGLKDGTIDVISSGHMPTTLESKYMEFDNADFGISSLETAFSTSYTALVEKNILSLPQLIQKMSYNPSKILQLNKGKIDIGAEADIIIVDIKDEYEIDASLFMSKAKFTPFQGQRVKGKIVHTIVKGKQIF